MHFKVRSHQETIKRLRNHEVIAIFQLCEMFFMGVSEGKETVCVFQLRSAFTNLVRENTISNLKEGECFITADFPQKWIPAFFYEQQSLYFGKAGRMWHVTHCLCVVGGQYVQHFIVHLIEAKSQVHCF